MANRGLQQFAFAFLVLFTCLSAAVALENNRRKVIIDQDAAGPGGSDQQSIMLMIQSPQVEVLGITVVTGDQWLQEEVAHTLRMLELIGRTDIPVYAGAEYPLKRTQSESEDAQKHFGKVGWLGAWTPQYFHPHDQLGDMLEGKPTTKAADEDAAHFMVRMVRKFPGEVTIYEGGPMTNIALALAIDPDFASLAKELVFMGGSLKPMTDDPEFAYSPSHEFNLWFDPEAAHATLTASWKKIVCTPVDISVKTRLTPGLIEHISKADTPSAKYIGSYAKLRSTYNYMWDEMAAEAWIDPAIITRKRIVFMDVDLTKGPNYGNTLVWPEKDKPEAISQPIEFQDDFAITVFYKMFVDLLSAPSLKP